MINYDATNKIWAKIKACTKSSEVFEIIEDLNEQNNPLLGEWQVAENWTDKAHILEITCQYIDKDGKHWADIEDLYFGAQGLNKPKIYFWRIK